MKPANITELKLAKFLASQAEW